MKTKQTIRPMPILMAVSIMGCAVSAWAAEEDFNRALTAANAGNVGQLEQYRWSMNGDVLGYYPEYWILNQNLTMQNPSQIIQFAQRYNDSAMAEKLAADYVEEMVKIGNYSAATAVIPYVKNADKAENCAMVQAQSRTGDELSIATRREVFWATDKQPEACDSLAASMVHSAMFNAVEKQARLWGLLRSGLTGQALSTGSALGVPLSLSQLNQIQADPQSYLWSAPKATATDHAYLIFALGRLANNDLNAAFYAVERAADNVPQDVKQYLYRTVAYIGGTTVGKNNFNEQVVRYFQKSEGYFFSPEEAEIYARQALRFGEWVSLQHAIQNMTPNQQQEERWQYWLARAYEKQGQSSKAKSIYKNLADGDDYYHLWAKARLGERVHHKNDVQPTLQDFQRLDQDIHFKRAFTLRNINAPATYTTREWNWAVRQAYLKQDDGLLLAAAKRAIDLGWYDRAIYAADRTVKRHNYQYRYVTPYREQIVASSQQAGINPAWAYGIMRQESRFNVSARSHVGAGGLMQVMPDTAKVIARELGESYNASTANSIAGNIRYGTYYLGKLERESGNPVVATAGYNAGPNRATRWQPSSQMIEADQYAESIPFLETRDYVKHVMTNATHYSDILGQANISIQQRMPNVAVRW
ncbi:MAG: transglycosylase SLT domain-containing protein [Acinetobacter sp.]|nr:transglycosylase SLT domain-containing protein [Acinetobacter sp.]